MRHPFTCAGSLISNFARARTITGSYGPLERNIPLLRGANDNLRFQSMGWGKRAYGHALSSNVRPTQSAGGNADQNVSIVPRLTPSSSPPIKFQRAGPFASAEAIFGKTAQRTNLPLASRSWEAPDTWNSRHIVVLSSTTALSVAAAVGSAGLPGGTAGSAARTPAAPANQIAMIATAGHTRATACLLCFLFIRCSFSYSNAVHCGRFDPSSTRPHLISTFSVPAFSRTTSLDCSWPPGRRHLSVMGPASLRQMNA